MLPKDWPGAVSVGDKSGQKVRSLAKAKCLSNFRKKISWERFLIFWEKQDWGSGGWVGSKILRNSCCFWILERASTWYHQDYYQISLDCRPEHLSRHSRSIILDVLVQLSWDCRKGPVKFWTLRRLDYVWMAWPTGADYNSDNRDKYTPIPGSDILEGIS